MTSCMPRSTKRPSCRPYNAIGVADSLIDLLLLPLREADTMFDRGGPEAMYMRAQAFIREHLRDPDLCIDQISAALGCTKRYLHMLFSDTRHDRQRLYLAGAGCSTAARSWRPRPERPSPTSHFRGAFPVRRISAACSASISASCRPPSTRRSTAACLQTLSEVLRLSFTLELCLQGRVDGARPCGAERTRAGKNCAAVREVGNGGGIEKPPMGCVTVIEDGGPAARAIVLDTSRGGGTG